MTEERIWEAYAASLFEFRVTLQTLCVVLVVLKLLGTLQITWFWALSPMILVITLAFIFYLLYLFTLVREKNLKEKNKENGEGN